MNSRVNFEDVNVERKLSVSKRIHATWLVEMYITFSPAHGGGFILKGWEKAGIKEVVTGREVFSSADPCQDIYTNDS